MDKSKSQVIFEITLTKSQKDGLPFSTKINEGIWIKGDVPELSEFKRLEHIVDGRVWRIQLDFDSQIEQEVIHYKYYYGSFENSENILEESVDLQLKTQALQKNNILVEDQWHDQEEQYVQKTPKDSKYINLTISFNTQTNLDHYKNEHERQAFYIVGPVSELIEDPQQQREYLNQIDIRKNAIRLERIDQNLHVLHKSIPQSLFGQYGNELIFCICKSFYHNRVEGSFDLYGTTVAKLTNEIEKSLQNQESYDLAVEGIPIN